MPYLLSLRTIEGGKANQYIIDTSLLDTGELASRLVEAFRISKNNAYCMHAEKTNLKEIERKAYMSYHQDGLIDVFAGFLILSFGLWLILDMTWMGWILWFVAVSAYAVAKRVVTIPRIGLVKFVPHARMHRANKPQHLIGSPTKVVHHSVQICAHFRLVFQTFCDALHILLV